MTQNVNLQTFAQTGTAVINGVGSLAGNQVVVNLPVPFKSNNFKIFLSPSYNGIDWSHVIYNATSVVNSDSQFVINVWNNVDYSLSGVQLPVNWLAILI